MYFLAVLIKKAQVSWMNLKGLEFVALGKHLIWNQLHHFIKKVFYLKKQSWVDVLSCSVDEQIASFLEDSYRT
jgi:hypothetical protein